MSQDIHDIFSQIIDSGLSDTFTADELKEYNQYLESTSKEVADLFSISDSPEYIQNLKLDELIKLPFEKAHKIIKILPMARRLSVLEELDTYRLYLYEQTARYQGVSQDLMITPAEFQRLLGKIKHLEIMQAWLFGIE